MRGLSFEIPNRYGQFLLDILNAFDFKNYFWKTGGEEAYYIENDKLGSPLFPKPYLYTGDAFYKRISETDYYLIFADLKAFPDPLHVRDFTSYEQFLNSQCEFVLLLVDCSYVTIYAKDQQVLKALHDQAIASKYENVSYITDENDSRTTFEIF
ncbi:DUF2691 family protein [Solibacillus sp. A46]|uniref:DUF2691 family protein n=1 Tax=Solibacillus faecavium TaxID=2762221 RepID=A0ABR8XWK3_9BACL|nr:DUF2691 family protein [Solibacillus faecavium]MBD8036329.1 DUF2691 family protein [Solibacillus faecavium]